jgi:hypothetical protein
MLEFLYVDKFLNVEESGFHVTKLNGRVMHLLHHLANHFP